MGAAAYPGSVDALEMTRKHYGQSPQARSNMNAKIISALLILFLIGCKNEAQRDVKNIDLGNKFIDAFYSFNSDSLQIMLLSAKKSQPDILFYQKWAECAHYRIVDRSRFFKKSDSLLIFPVTVKDDLMSALKIDFNVTDTFHLSIENGKIISVKTSSNDLDTYYQAKEWVSKNRPELVAIQCDGNREGGPTPCECVLGMIRGFTEFTEFKKKK